MIDQSEGGELTPALYSLARHGAPREVARGLLLARRMFSCLGDLYTVMTGETAAHAFR